MPRPLSAAPAVAGSRPPARAGAGTTLEGPAPDGPPAGDALDGMGPPSLPAGLCAAGAPAPAAVLDGPMSPASAGTARPTNRPPASASVPITRRSCISSDRLLAVMVHPT